MLFNAARLAFRGFTAFHCSQTPFEDKALHSGLLQAAWARDNLGKNLC